MKRGFDCTIAIVGLVLLSPVLLVVSVLIRMTMGKPILFRQTRPGRYERPFMLLKFRTMTEAIEEDGHLKGDGERLTRLGRMIRASSVDELPQLWNVVRGEMSLVGPRPLLMRYLPFFTEVERARFSVMPGISGLAQVRGRNNLAWTDRLASDIEYVERWSLQLDFCILAKTAWQVVKRDGIRIDPGAEMLDLDVERRTWREGRSE